MFNISYLALGAIAVGLAATLVLASMLTPASWWRQLNLRALAVVGFGTWGIASLVMWLAQADARPGSARLAAPLAAGVAGVAPLAPAGERPQPGHRYRVHDDLNLRIGKGTGAPRIAVVRAGSVVTATGVRDGDWWQVSARVEGKDVLGWSSSLWLRRADERAL